MKKYEFTGLQKSERIDGKLVTLNQIRATKDFGDVKNGQIGGFIEKEKNLSQNGLSWVRKNAQVRGNARVCGDALVYGNAQVCGNALVDGNARVSGNARVRGNAWVGGNAQVCENALVDGNARVGGNAWVCENARVYGNAQVYGNAWVYGNARVSENALISKIEDLFIIGPIGSRNDFVTFYKNQNNGISVKCGCFFGTIEEFLEKVKQTHGDTKHGRTYKLAAELAKLQILEEEGDEQSGT